MLPTRGGQAGQHTVQEADASVRGMCRSLVGQPGLAAALRPFHGERDAQSPARVAWDRHPAFAAPLFHVEHQPAQPKQTKAGAP